MFLSQLCRYCLLLIVAVNQPGMIWVRKMEKPMPAVVKKKSACAGVKLVRKSADEPPNPSID